MTPSAGDRDRARRRVLLQRSLLVVTRRSEVLGPAPTTTVATRDDGRPAAGRSSDRDDG